MPRKCRSTFDEWVEYEEGDPISIKKEDLPETYESLYVTLYNHIRSKGWIREASMWVSPKTGGKYKTVAKAYTAQRLYEIQDAPLKVRKSEG